jgi:hypothetical protein
MDTNVIIAVLTAVIALFTFLVWRVYRRIEWLTGAMETHSALQLRLEAAKVISPNGQQVRVVWWDPDIAPPPVTPEHGKEAEINQVYLYLPPKLRRNHKKLTRRLWRWFSGT